MSKIVHPDAPVRQGQQTPAVWSQVSKSRKSMIVVVAGLIALTVFVLWVFSAGKYFPKLAGEAQQDVAPLQQYLTNTATTVQDAIDTSKDAVVQARQQYSENANANVAAVTVNTNNAPNLTPEEKAALQAAIKSATSN